MERGIYNFYRAGKPGPGRISLRNTLSRHCWEIKAGGCSENVQSLNNGMLVTKMPIRVFS